MRCGKYPTPKKVSSDSQTTSLSSTGVSRLRAVCGQRPASAPAGTAHSISPERASPSHSMYVESFSLPQLRVFQDHPRDKPRNPRLLSRLRFRCAVDSLQLISIHPPFNRPESILARNRWAFPSRPGFCAGCTQHGTFNSQVSAGLSIRSHGTVRSDPNRWCFIQFACVPFFRAPPPSLG